MGIEAVNIRIYSRMFESRMFLIGLRILLINRVISRMLLIYRVISLQGKIFVKNSRFTLAVILSESMDFITSKLLEIEKNGSVMVSEFIQMVPSAIGL